MPQQGAPCGSCQLSLASSSLLEGVMALRSITVARPCYSLPAQLSLSMGSFWSAHPAQPQVSELWPVQVCSIAGSQLLLSNALSRTLPQVCLLIAMWIIYTCMFLGLKPVKQSCLSLWGCVLVSPVNNC